MNGKKLNLLRKLLFLSQAEAARSVGLVNIRTWRHWENGTYKIPKDVEDEILKLVAYRTDVIEGLSRSEIVAGDCESMCSGDKPRELAFMSAVAHCIGTVE